MKIQIVREVPAAVVKPEEQGWRWFQKEDGTMCITYWDGGDTVDFYEMRNDEEKVRC